MLKMNNRVLLGISLVICLLGCVLLADWQAIGHSNTCSMGPANISILSSNNTHSGKMHINSNSGSFAVELLPYAANSTSNSSLYQQLLESCEALSNSSHQCFWNPESRVTGEFCNTCLLTCLSQQASLNFYQFSVGTLLILVGPLLVYVFISAIASDITPKESQVYIIMLNFVSVCLEST